MQGLPEEDPLPLPKPGVFSFRLYFGPQPAREIAQKSAGEVKPLAEFLGEEDGGGLAMLDDDGPVEFLPPSETFEMPAIVNDEVVGIPPEDDGFILGIWKAAHGGDPDAQMVIGFYHFRRGKEFMRQNPFDNTQDIQEFKAAFTWMSRAHKQGKLDMEIHMAHCHCNGWGTPKDPFKARDLYSNVAERDNDPDAQYMLGQLYRHGALDGEPNVEMAFVWNMKAARQGHMQARVEVAHAYLFGWGVDADGQEAKKWYLLAGDEGACMQDMVEGLTDHQEQQAKVWAEEWH